MKKWSFENGIKVHENEYDADLHCLKVYNNNKYLGTVYPQTIENMESCFKDLEAGIDPISGGWEDGCGNSCTLDGWNNDDEED